MTARAMTRRPAILAALAAAAATAGALPTAAQPRLQILPCALRVIVVPRAGTPTVLRVAPSVRARVLRPIPRSRTGIAAEVYGVSGVWFQVRNLRTGHGRPIGPQGAQTHGGWIHGSRLAIRLQDAAGKSAALYEDPQAAATVIARVSARRRNRQGVLMSCRGRWARLRLGPVIGWVPPRHQCSRPTGACR